MSKSRLNISVLFTCILIFSIFHGSTRLILDHSKIEQNYLPNSISPSSATIHNPILLWNDSALQSFPNKTGSGTFEAPYIIENLEINALGSGSPINLRNITLPLIIKNCILSGSEAFLENGGITLKNCSNIQILNNSLFANFDNIAIINSSHIILDNNTLNFALNRGIYINTTVNASITTNQILNSTNEGILSVSTNSSRILSNFIRNNSYGIYFSTPTQDNVIDDNDIVQNRLRGIYFFQFGMNNTISHNLIKQNTQHGIYFGSYSQNNTLFLNQIVSNNAYGVYLNNFCHFNKIDHNNISNNMNSAIYSNSGSYWNNISTNTLTFSQNYGIDMMANCQYWTIFNNTISHNQYAIQMSNTNNYHIIANNTMEYNSRGVSMSSSGSYNNTITNNTIAYGVYGLYLISTVANTTIDNNKLHNFTQDAIRINGIPCINNIITRNEFFGNDLGIYFDGTKNNFVIENRFILNTRGIEIQGGSGYHKIWFNSFINNTNNNLDFNGSSKWDNGVFGNYWSNYQSIYPVAILNGTVWSIEYIMAGGPANKDNYPLLRYPLTLPPAPNLVTDNQIIHTSSLILNWTIIPEAQTYNIYRNGIFVETTSSNNYTITFGQPGDYILHIKSQNQLGISLPSNQIQITWYQQSDPDPTDPDPTDPKPTDLNPTPVEDENSFIDGFPVVLVIGFMLIGLLSLNSKLKRS